MISDQPIQLPNLEVVHQLLFCKDSSGKTVLKKSSQFICIRRDTNLLEPEVMTKCRESLFYYFFVTYSKELQERFYWHKWAFAQLDLDLKKINHFLSIIERKLNVPLAKRTILHRTNSDCICMVEPSPFWTSDWVRYSFFTLFFRCAAEFYKKGMKLTEAFTAYPLSKKILNAVQYFLAGHVQPTFSPVDKFKCNFHTYGVVFMFGDAKYKPEESLVKPAVPIFETKP